MSAIPVRLPENEMRVVSCEMLDKLIKIGDGDAALLYLYMVRNGNGTEKENALRELNFSQDRYERAVFSLSGLSTPPVTDQDKQQQGAPKYTIEELRRAREDDHKFSAVCHIAEDTLGRTLTEPQLRCLFTAYDHLGISAEAIIEMLAYLKNEKEIVRTTDIRREAYKWADMGVVSAKDAQNYIARLESEKPFTEALYRAIGADTEQPSPKAQRICTFAISHGFPPEAVELASKRTATNKGRRSLDYTLGILRRWDSVGVHTVSEITALEPEVRVPVPVQAVAGGTEATENAVLEQWEQDWAERVRSHRRKTEE